MSVEKDKKGLTAADWRVLDALLSQRGRVSSRETLTRLTSVENASGRRIDVSIVAIRKALGPDSITTVRQRGWILTEDGVREAEILIANQLNMNP